MRRRETSRHDVVRHPRFDTGIITALTGRPHVAARIGGTEACAGPKTVGATHEFTS